MGTAAWVRSRVRPAEPPGGQASQGRVAARGNSRFRDRPRNTVREKPEAMRLRRRGAARKAQMGTAVWVRSRFRPAEPPGGQAQLWRSGALALWRSGALALWRSGALALWRSGALALWRSGALALWRSGALALWRSGALALWRSGALALWRSGALALWRSGALALWRSGALALWRSGALALWRSGALALWRSGALALWRSGALALWRSGALALWRSGALALNCTLPKRSPAVKAELDQQFSLWRFSLHCGLSCWFFWRFCGWRDGLGAGAGDQAFAGGGRPVMTVVMRTAHDAKTW